MHLLSAAIGILSATQAYDPKPDLCNLYKAFGMEVGPPALVRVSPDSLEGLRLYNGPEVQGKKTRATFTGNASQQLTLIQVSNATAKLDVHSSQALPWASLDEAKSAASEVAARITTGYPLLLRLVTRGDRLDYGVSELSGVGLHAVYDYKVDGYPFLHPQVGVDLSFDRNGVLRTATRTIQFPSHEPVGEPLKTQSEAISIASSSIPYPVSSKAVLGWISVKGRPAKLMWRVISRFSQSGKDSMIKTDLDAVTGQALQSDSYGLRSTLMEALMP